MADYTVVEVENAPFIGVRVEGGSLNLLCQIGTPKELIEYLFTEVGKRFFGVAGSDEVISDIRRFIYDEVSDLVAKKSIIKLEDGWHFNNEDQIDFVSHFDADDIYVGVYKHLAYRTNIQ